MKIKTYEGETLQEAFKKMQQEMSTYGYNSSVISTRSYTRGGIFGFFGRPVVQVTAAIDESGSEAVTFPATAAPGEAPAAPAAPARPRAPRQEARQSRGDLFKTRAKQPARRGREAQRPRRREQAAPEMPAAVPALPGSGIPAHLQRLYHFLTDSEVESDLARDLAAGIGRKVAPRDAGDTGLVRRLLKDSIVRLMNTAGPIELQEKHLKIVAFVGPTGVGKTTTIAKLAADFTFNQKKKVALITLDTYRIAAVEQLKTYAQIMNLPIEVARDPAELRMLVNTHADKDVILIDTAGRSPRDDMYISELGSFLNAVDPVETHLVLSAGTRYRDICSIIEKYGRIRIDRIVVSKLDEISSFGNLVNLKDRVSIPLSYITTGQNVPQDIETADAAKLAGMIVDATARHGY